MVSRENGDVFGLADLIDQYSCENAAFKPLLERFGRILGGGGFVQDDGFDRWLGDRGFFRRRRRGGGRRRDGTSAALGRREPFLFFFLRRRFLRLWCRFGRLLGLRRHGRRPGQAGAQNRLDHFDAFPTWEA